MSARNPNPYLLVSFITLAGCQQSSLDEGSAEVHSPARTGAMAAREMLNARIDSQQKNLPSTPQLHHVQSLVDLMLLRLEFFGKSSDLANILSLTNTTAEDHPDDVDMHKLRARAYAAAHLFSDSLQEYEKAEKAGSIDLRIAKDSLLIAMGNPSEQIEMRRQELVDQFPSAEGYISLAISQAALGKYEKADQSYQRGLDSYRNVTPYIPASIQFQRGLMWSELAGDSQRGYEYYQQSVEYLPDFVSAQVHFAELKITEESEDSAVQGLEEVLRFSEDPEPASLAAELLRTENSRSQALLNQAKTSYQQLLSQHPEAYADHGSEFYRSVGQDSERAFRLAKQNLELRTTPRAYQLAILAGIEEGEHQEVCVWINTAAKFKYHQPLQALISDAQVSCN